MGMNRGRSTGEEGGWEEGREQGGGAGEWGEGEGEGGRKRAKGEEVGREHPTPSTHQSSRNRRRRLCRKGGRLATDCLFKNSGAATKSRVVSTTNSNSMRSIKTAH